MEKKCHKLHRQYILQHSAIQWSLDAVFCWAVLLSINQNWRFSTYKKTSIRVILPCCSLCNATSLYRIIFVEWLLTLRLCLHYVIMYIHFFTLLYLLWPQAGPPGRWFQRRTLLLMQVTGIKENNRLYSRTQRTVENILIPRVSMTLIQTLEEYATVLYKGTLPVWKLWGCRDMIIFLS